MSLPASSVHLAERPPIEARPQASTLAPALAHLATTAAAANSSLASFAIHAQPGAANAHSPAQPRPYWGDALYSFQTVYWPIHCVICLAICTLGIFANVTNIIVLTRPNMITAVNTILSAMAFSDLIVNISNIPYLAHQLSDSSDQESFFSHQWALYILFHAHTTVTAHTISIWLTCVLATWRYFVVCRSQSSNQRNWSVGLAKRTILCVFLLVPLFCIPNYLSFSIVSEQVALAPEVNSTSPSATLYKVGFSEMANESQFIKTFHFWIFSCLTKLVPCVLLTFFTTVLIRKLLQARERRLRLVSYGGPAHLGAQQPGATEARMCAPEDEGGQRKRGPSDEAPGGGAGVESATLAPSEASPGREADAAGERAECGPKSRKGSVKGRLLGKVKVGKLYKRQEERRHSALPETKFSRPANNAGSNQNGSMFENSSSSNTNKLGAANNGARVPGQLSGSDCLTEAEILGTSCNSSTSGETRANETKTRILSQLIVETSSATNNITTISTSTAPTKMLASNAAERAKRRYTHEAPRSGSTCAVLESYSRQSPCKPAVLLEDDTKEADDNESPPNAKQQRASLALSAAGGFASSATHLDDSTRFNSKLVSETTVFGTRPRSSSGANNCTGFTATGIAPNPAGIAPFQVVKLQSAQRQLSQNETTTRLLIAVMIVFLICEFPAGILAACCAIFGEKFFENVYQPTGILTDLLALINSSVNFILYCFMSTQFRITFYQVVLHCPAPQPPQHQRAFVMTATNQQKNHQQQQQEK